VEHERAHVSSFDNLKKLALKVTRMPDWLNLSRMPDSAWTNACEIAADETALASGASVLDLSGALIKVAALSSQSLYGEKVLDERVAVSHLVFVESGTSLQARVDRLQKILEGDATSRAYPRSWAARVPIAVVLAVIAYATSVNALLPWVHEALEALVR
jgi:hypothetical protein